MVAQQGEATGDHLKAAYETARDLGAETLRRRVARAMKDAGSSRPAPRGWLRAS